MSNILVTGGAGFIGTNLIKELLIDGHNVANIVSIDDYSSGSLKNHQEGCEYIVGDIKEKKLDTKFLYGHKFDIIFHLAARARIQPSFKNPHLTLENNFIGTLNVLEYARHCNAQVIYAGSSSKHHGLYGSPYAWSKYGGEQLCYLYSSVYGMNTVICRFYNVYGKAHIRIGEYATVIGIFEQQYMEGEPLTIVGDGEQRRDFTHIDDITDGLIRCMGLKFNADEFELGSGSNYSINEVANMFGKDYPKKYIPERKGEYPFTLCSDKKATEMLGWQPEGDLKSYIKHWLNERKKIKAIL